MVALSPHESWEYRGDFQTSVAISCLWPDTSASSFSPLPLRAPLSFISSSSLYLPFPGLCSPAGETEAKLLIHPLAGHKEEQQNWEWSCKLQAKTLEEQSQKSKGAEGKQQEKSKSQLLERDKINQWQISSILRLCQNFLHPQLCIFAKCHWLVCTAI